MQNPPYLPKPNSGLRAWVVNFAAVLTADEAAYNLDPADSAAVNAVVTPWVTAYDLTQNPATRTPAAIADSDQKKAAMLAVVQPYATGISRDASVTDENKATIGVTIPSAVRTPVTTPTAQPLLSVASMVSNLASIRANNSDTPNSKAVPPGCAGIEVFVKYGTDYTNDPTAATYVDRFTKFPFKLDTTGKSGQKASIFARYVTARGNGGVALKGPWSLPLQTPVI